MSMIPFKFNPFGISYEKKPVTNQPLRFTAAASYSNVYLKAEGDYTLYSGIQYRTDSSASWSNYEFDEDGNGQIIPLIDVGDYVEFQNTEETLSEDSNDYVQFVMDGNINGSGNIMSLLNYINTAPAYSFYNLFYLCSAMRHAPDLLANSVGTKCCESMFEDCSNLNSTPTLSPTSLAQDCYKNMFRNCTSLPSVPDLPAKVLAEGCYYYMFYNCTSLTSAPTLYATTLAQNCYKGMFEQCSSLISAGNLPATTLAFNCYDSMFRNCSNLVVTPLISGTELVSACCNYMFYGCSKITMIRVRFTNWKVGTCTGFWCYNVPEIGTFEKPTDLSSEERGESYIPNGWSIVNI